MKRVPSFVFNKQKLSCWIYTLSNIFWKWFAWGRQKKAFSAKDTEKVHKIVLDDRVKSFTTRQSNGCGSTPHVSELFLNDQLSCNKYMRNLFNIRYFWRSVLLGTLRDPAFTYLLITSKRTISDQLDKKKRQNWIAKNE